MEKPTPENTSVSSVSNEDALRYSYPIKLFRTTIPYGYAKVSREDYILKGGDPDLPLEEGYSAEFLLVPDPTEISLLDSALNQLDNGSTVQDTLNWINAQNTNRSLSFAGLYKLWGLYNPNHKKRSPVKKPTTPKVLTPEQREIKKKKLLIAQEKKKIAFAKKRQEKFEVELGLRQEVSKLQKSMDKTPLVMEIDYSSMEVPEEEIIFKPNEGPQTEFFASNELEVLYGGAAGGESVSRFYRLLSQ